MSDPKRQPCTGSVPYSANCGGAAGVLKKFKNVTTMKDETGTPVAPFERYDFDDACSGSVTSCIPIGGGSGSHCASVLTDGMVRADFPADTVDEPGYNPVTDPILVSRGNRFEAVVPPVLDSCASPYGFKTATGVKAWHGAFPFDHTVDGINCKYPWEFFESGSYNTTGAEITNFTNWSAGSYASGSFVLHGGGGWKALEYTEDAEPGTDATKWLQGVPNRSGVKYLKREFELSEFVFKSYIDAQSQVSYAGTSYGLSPGIYKNTEDEYRFGDSSPGSIVRAVNRFSGEITNTNAVKLTSQKWISSGSPPNAAYYIGNTEYSPGQFLSFPSLFDGAADHQTGIQQCFEFYTDDEVWTLKNDIIFSPRCLSNLPFFTTGGGVTTFPLKYLATNTRIGSTNLSDGDTATVGSVVYTFRATPLLVNEIEIGASPSVTINNFYGYISANGHPQVLARNDIDSFGWVLERLPGIVGDISISYNCATSDTEFFGPKLPPEETYSGWVWSETVPLPDENPKKTITIDINISRTEAAYSFSCSIKSQYDALDIPGSMSPAQTANLGKIFICREVFYSGTISLSEPYKIGDNDAEAADPNCLRDWAELVRQWPFTDKISPPAHPFRTDEKVFVGVEVRRDEKNATSPEIDFDACPVQDYTIWPLDESVRRPWFDPGCYAWKYNPPTNSTEASTNELISTGVYTGKIIGKPLPAGYGATAGGSHRGCWDAFFQRWQRKYCPAEYKFVDSNVTRGMWTPSYLPANAQMWTRHDDWPNYTFADLELGVNRTYPCSYIKADQYGIHGQKMVETIVPRPAYDLSRPHTRDRFLLVQPTDPESLTLIYYVDSVVGSVVTLKLRDGTAASDVSADFSATLDADGLPDIVGPVEIGGVNGFYKVTASGATVTVGALWWKVPTGFTNDSRDADRAFGKLRYKVAPGFGGLLKVAATDSSGDTLLTYADNPSIQTGDKIDLWNGTAFDDNGGAGYTLTRLTDTTATISGAHLDTTHIVPHTYFVYDPVTPTNRMSGQKWYYTDTTSHGDFLAHQKILNIDTGTQEVITKDHQLCLPAKPCANKVAGFGPEYLDGDSDPIQQYCNERDADFVNARIEPMPLLVHNGNQWLGQTIQHIVDRLWVAPHKPFNPVAEGETPGVWVDSEGYEYGNISWRMDDGTCLPDDDSVPDHLVSYYRMPDFYEALFMFTPVWGSSHDQYPPNPPADTTIPWARLGGSYQVRLSVPPTGSFDRVADFWFDQEIKEVATPWGIYQRQSGCVCADGRFYEAYQANGVSC